MSGIDKSISCNNCFQHGHDRVNCPWTQDELHGLSDVAAFIAARLNYVLPPCNSGKKGGRLMSTIRVDQHKQKFFWIRIYCTLADPEMVREKYLAEREREAEPDEPTKEFTDQCFQADAWHYRTCYIDMIRLLPEKYKGRIRSQADYAELLFDDAAEMRSRIDAQAQPDPEMPGYDALQYKRQKYGVQTNEELKDRLATFYERPRRWIGDA